MVTLVRNTIFSVDIGQQTFHMSLTNAVPTISVTEAREDMPAAKSPATQRPLMH